MVTLIRITFNGYGSKDNHWKRIFDIYQGLTLHFEYFDHQNRQILERSVRKVTNDFPWSGKAFHFSIIKKDITVHYDHFVGIYLKYPQNIHRFFDTYIF